MKRVKTQNEYYVRLSWEKFINFPPIEARSKAEAEALAYDMLCDPHNNLLEEKGEEMWQSIKKQ